MAKRKFWETKSFYQLQQEWYLKLENTGFQDHETKKGHDLVLKQRASNSYRQASEIIRENKERYFELISNYLNSAIFDDAVDRLVMERTSQGKKRCEISLELKELGERCHRKTVMFIVRKYEDRWGIRKWNPNQLKSK